MQIYCRFTGHLGGLEVLEFFITFFLCFQPIVSQPSNKYKAGMAPSQTFLSLFAHVLFIVLESDCMCSSLCQLSGEWGFHSWGWGPCACLWMFVGVSTSLGPRLKWVCINEKTMGCLVLQMETIDSLPTIRTGLSCFGQSPSSMRKVSDSWSSLF